jgi:hypothetical protein
MSIVLRHFKWIHRAGMNTAIHCLSRAASRRVGRISDVLCRILTFVLKLTWEFREH